MIHRFIMSILIITAILAAGYFAYTGYDYYFTPKLERPHHSDHTDLKPSGLIGHGLGIVGSSFMLLLFLYSARKRLRFMSGWGNIRKWLNVHIFLGITGPVLVTFHSALKFGGIITVAYVSMIAVMASGFIGRYLYAQIPRSLRGTEMDLREMDDLNKELNDTLKSYPGVDDSFIEKINHIAGYDKTIRHRNVFATLFFVFQTDLLSRWRLWRLRSEMAHNPNFPKKEILALFKLARRKAIIQRKIANLSAMKQLFHYWHVAHKPFAYTMIIIMFVHIFVAILFGYRWIF